MRAFLSEFLKWFLIINTGIMVIVWINIFKYDTIWTAIIPQIFGASFLTSLVTAAYFSYNPRKPISVPVRILLTIAHYLILCVIIMTLGTRFNWFELTLQGGLAVTLSVAGVYIISAVISYMLSKGEADEMTDALKKYKEED
ncbi:MULTISPECIES: DUF3021 family protein [unclassified Butyrivibrio]|uniref:DUF3021 family protein n=1 Tax=unclassified Butyrivibrio TaxID=2639466 RepID=UPI00040A8BD8|nr:MULTISPECIES: DUF3021 family protein [unclassified Butyrivibrio]